MGMNEIQRPQYEQSARVPKTPDWFREPGIERGYRPWQHTPLRPFSENVSPHQNELHQVFEGLTFSPAPENLHKELQELVHIDFMTGNARRQIECAANFEAWVAEHPEELEAIESNQEMCWLLHEAIAGHGHPASLLRLMAIAPSLKSLDLQVLTMPYGHRSEHLGNMRDEMRMTLNALGGVYFTEPVDVHLPAVSIHPFDDYEISKRRRGLIVVDKRHIGRYLPDGESGETVHVKERRAFVVDADTQNGFSPDAFIWLHSPHDSVEYEEGLHYIDELIETESPLVIPTSTMVYACRPTKLVRSEPNPIIEEHRLLLDEQHLPANE